MRSPRCRRRTRYSGFGMSLGERRGRRVRSPAGPRGPSARQRGRRAGPTCPIPDDVHGAPSGRTACLADAPVTPFEALAIMAAGLAAGAINTIVGSGLAHHLPDPAGLRLSRRSWPTCPTRSASCPGSISGAVGYRRELVGQRARAIRLGSVAALGGLTGGLLLLALPASSFGTHRALAHPVRLRPDGAPASPVADDGPASAPGCRASPGARRWRVPDRHLRWLLRRGPGGHPHRAAVHLPGR